MVQVMGPTQKSTMLTSQILQNLKQTTDNQPSDLISMEVACLWARC